MPQMSCTVSEAEHAWVKAMAVRLHCRTTEIVRIALNNWIAQELNGEGTYVENEVPGEAAERWVKAAGRKAKPVCKK